MARSSEALVELGRRSIVRGMRPRGLDLDGLDQLLQAPGAAADDDLLDRVQRRTGGNPFFVTELLRLLPTERPGPRPDGRGGGDRPGRARPA